MAKDDSPPTWQEALSQASAAIASAMASPDADVKFGLALIGAISSHTQKKSQPPQAGGAGAGAPGGPGGAGAGSPVPPGVAPAGAPGNATNNPQMRNQAAPGGPIPGGMSPGLGISGDAQNADELRRVLSDVAGS